MKLIISIDVEEEGLFSGIYARIPQGVRNVEALRRLEFIPREFGFPLTLMVTYPVALDPGCQRILLRWREDYHAEIGAHLHPWNTPPFMEIPLREPAPSDSLPLSLLQAKFETLLAVLKENFGGAPASFRMGRFDLGEQVLALLPKCGISVDSSVVPLRHNPGIIDQFLLPPDPFVLKASPPDGGDILEAPLTVIPWSPNAPRWIYHLASFMPHLKREKFLKAFRHAGAVGVHPAWFPLASMLWAVRLHRARGGRVLTMFLHSSELQPGASPGFPNERAVSRLIRKIRIFLAWLIQTGSVQGITLSELPHIENLTKESMAFPRAD